MKTYQVALMLSLTVCVLLIRTASAQTGVPYQISGDLVTGGDVSTRYQISSDGEYVVYIADQRVDGILELFSVPITGGTPVRLNPPLVADGGVRSFEISADSKRVIYRANQRFNNVFELFSVPIDGGAITRLNPDLVANGAVFSGFQISADSKRVIYSADQNSDNVFELFSVPIVGGAAVRLNPDLVVNGGVLINQFQISPDSTRVIYRADQNSDEVFELFSVPIAGGTAIRLNPDLAQSVALPPFPFTITVGDVAGFEISADSARVIYRADQRFDNLFELFSVPIAGGASVRLNPDFINPDGDIVGRFQVSADSERVIYIADRTIDNRFYLYSVPIDGGTARQLNEDTVSGGSTAEFLISPDSTRVIYRADQNADDIFELFSVPIAGGAAVRLNLNLAPNGDVTQWYQISADSTRVVYLADQNTDGVLELFSVPISGGTTTRLNPGLVANGDVFEGFQISADSERVIYRADQRFDDVNELFSVPITGGAATRVNDGLPTGADVNNFLINANGSFVVYRADQDVVDEIELFASELIDDSFCAPIKARNGNVAVICL